MKTLYFGGSFNPPHNGHLIMAQTAMEQCGFDRVVFLPCANAPHKTGLLPFENRLAMLIEVCDANSSFNVFTLEETLFEQNGNKSYTIETVRELKRQGESEVNLLIGEDSLKMLHTWKDADKLIIEANFYVVPREGVKFGYSRDLQEKAPMIKIKVPEFKWTTVPSAMVGVSSSILRARLEKGLMVDYWVQPSVAAYIKRHNLYRKTT